MNRVGFLMQGLEINEVQASLISELISDIPNNQLKNFLVFRMKYVEPYKSKELITKEALWEYRRIQAESRLRKGERLFNSVDEVQKFVEEHYKGKEVGYGLGAYYNYVVIGMDNNGDFINKFVVLDSGVYKRIPSDEKKTIYEFLFKNQHRVGDVKYLKESDVKKIEDKSIDVEVLPNNTQVNEDVMNKIRTAVKRV